MLQPHRHHSFYYKNFSIAPVYKSMVTVVEFQRGYRIPLSVGTMEANDTNEMLEIASKQKHKISMCSLLGVS